MLSYYIGRNTWNRGGSQETKRQQCLSNSFLTFSPVTFIRKN